MSRSSLIDWLWVLFFVALTWGFLELLKALDRDRW